MKKVFCDCCNKEIKSTEEIYSLQTCKGYEQTGRRSEINLTDLCVSCHSSILSTINYLREKADKGSLL